MTSNKLFFTLAFAFVFLIGSASSVTAQITVTTQSTTQACNGDGTATITVTGGTAPYTFDWQTINGNIVSNVQNPTNLDGGDYYAIVTDALGVVNWHYVYVQPPFDIWQSNVVPATCGMSDGVVEATVIGGSAPYTFMWGNGTVNVSANTIDTLFNVPEGAVDLTVMDAAGCAFTPDSAGWMWANPSYALTTTTTPSDCIDGTASVTIQSGTPVLPVTYSWSHYNNNIGAYQTFTGQNISALEPGGYTVTATDAIGCSATSWAYVQPGPNYLQTYANITPSVCPQNNGAIDLVIVAGGTPPFTYVWSNGATTEDISGLASGNYSVQITDAAGCVIVRNKYVDGVSPVYASVSTTPATCWNSDGSATVSVTGGTPPYTYSWVNGATTATNPNLPMGYHGVTVTDANGCTDYAYANVTQPSGCWSYISGTVYDDLNGNCVVDAGDSPLAAQFISLGGNSYYYNSQQTGAFSAQVVPGTYSVMQVAQAGYTLNCPATPYSVTATAGNTYPGNDFYNEPDSIFSDLSVHLSAGAARPGFMHIMYASVRNNGTFMQSGTLEVTHDALLSYSYSWPTNGTYNAGTQTVSIPFSGLIPNEVRTFRIYSNVSAATPLTTPLQHTSFVGPIANDIDQVNNYDTLDLVVTGSYDPNIKVVDPVGVGQQGEITVADDVLDYTIHFQNTGTDTAFTVVLVDTLDTDLYIPSFKLLSTTHDVSYTIQGRTLTFTFDNILLVDSFTNEPLSHGSVSYSIEQMPSLAIGTEITNTAYIYFDFNEPIITNTTLNTIGEPNGVEDLASDFGVSVYPNPFDQHATIAYDLPTEAEVGFRVTDILGKVIFEQSATNKAAGQHQQTIAFDANLDSGVYFVQLFVDGQQVVKKIVH